MNTAVGRFLKPILPFGLVAALVAGVLLSDWVHSTASTGWLRMVAVEIQAACRDAGTQWMVVVCLVSYFVTFLFLERRQWNSTPHPSPLPVRGGEGGENAEGAETEGGRQKAAVRSRFSLFTFLRGTIWNPNFWLIGFGALVLLRYALSYETAARQLEPLILLAGIVFGKGIALWARWGNQHGEHSTPNLQLPTLKGADRESETGRRTVWILFVICALLGASALWQPEFGMEFQYRGQRRWTGVWDNPNIYGILMGVSVVLAIGQTGLNWKSKGRFEKGSRRREEADSCPEGRGDDPPRYLGGDENSASINSTHWLRLTFYFCAALLCGFGLIKSYSRGAWVGTVVGVAFLIWNGLRRKTHLTLSHSPRPTGREGELFARHTSLAVVVILASFLTISFWQFRHTENPLARRIFSIGNPNDFSWRNRVSTWAGTVTMMKDRPLVGYGWGKAEEVFREKYKPARLEDAAAIQMNDYLLLGISCGVPAVICFAAYIWLSCRRTKVESRAPAIPHIPEPRTQNQIAVLCVAGATVLLVGFWFDGGLFKLPTAAVFWVLWELSRWSNLPGSARIPAGVLQRPQNELAGQDARAPGFSRWDVLLRWLAGILALFAMGQTVLHLGTPQLAVGERTLSIARKFLVPPKEKTDFEFLATKPIWSAKQLGTLLEHVELANYNRELVNWKLDDQLYQGFVLSPEIDSARDGEMDWRRPLWESFYPRIRKENNLEAAAAIVVRHLRERVTIRAGDGAPDSIAAIWQRQSTNEKGFASIYIAALRSAGIPARRSASGQAEFWNGSEWKAAPRPLG